MRIKIQLFANLREKIGTSTLELDVKEPATVNDALLQLVEQFPRLRPHLTEKIVISMDQKIALRGDVLHDGAEIALMPPVSGG